MSKKTKKYGKGRWYQKPRRWTDEEEQFVRDNIKDMTHDQLADALGRSVGSVKGFTARKKIKRPGGGKFQKGHTPYNKGMRQQDYMSREAIESTKATRFKEGHKPHNTKWDGAITIRHRNDNSDRRPQVFIRLSEGNWELYRRYQYEKHVGPIPEGKIVAHKDGNTMNCYPENLELITRAENMARNRNTEKAAASMRKYWENNPHPAKELTDNYVAGMLSGGDEEIKQHLLSERQDLIRLARANYKLKRRIKDGEDTR